MKFERWEDFNKEKANVVIISKDHKYQKELYNKLSENRENKIQVVESAEYLGTEIVSYHIAMKNVENKITQARKQLCGLVNNGFTTSTILPLELRLLQVTMYVYSKCLTALDSYFIDSKCELKVNIPADEDKAGLALIP